jgi:plasmid stabilization system protein ParE
VNRARFVEPARLEVLAEACYYHLVEAGLGTKFLKAVEDATARALAYPLAGSPAQHRTRRVFLRDFPFALVYRSDEQGITIYALTHHARRPGYWRSRTNVR